jgi:hypothetical protein
MSGERSSPTFQVRVAEHWSVRRVMLAVVVVVFTWGRLGYEPERAAPGAAVHPRVR